MLQQCEYLVEPASLVTLYVCVSRCKLIVLAWSVYAPAGIVRRWEAGRVSAKQSLYPRPPCSFSIKMSACVLNTPAYMWQLPDILFIPPIAKQGGSFGCRWSGPYILFFTSEHEASLVLSPTEQTKQTKDMNSDGEGVATIIVGSSEIVYTPILQQ